MRNYIQKRRPIGRYRYIRLRWRILFAIIDFVGGVLFRIGAKFTKKSATGDPKTILLVQLDHMGDAVITTGMLCALRERWPKSKIEVLAGACNRELFTAMPQVDRVHVSYVNRFSRTGRTGWIFSTLYWGIALRKRNIDLAIDVRGEFPSALILWLCGARRRLGWDSGGGGFLLTDSPRFVPDRPETESRTALLAELGICPSETHCLPTFRPSQAARRRVAYLLNRSTTEHTVSGPRVLLHIGAGTSAKRWPIGHYRELLGHLIVRYDAEVILVGVESDRLLADKILGRHPWPNVTNWTGKLGIVALAALMEQSKLVIGADSGPAHLAASVGAPVITLWSGTNNQQQWKPKGERVIVVRNSVECSPCHRQECPFANHPCMADLRPSTVVDAIECLVLLPDKTPKTARHLAGVQQ